MKRFLYGCLGVGLMMAAMVSAQTTPSLNKQRQAALALEQQGKYAEAEVAWRALLQQHPKNPEPYAQIGVIEARLEHYKEAVPYYRKALALNPNVPGLRLNLGLALFKAGELKEAIPEFAQLLKNAPPNSPDRSRITILMGMAHYGLAEYSEAAPYLQRAVDHDSANLTLLMALAHSYLWSKQYQKVLDVYHQILVLNPDSAEADMLAGEALDEMKDSAGSTAMFRAAVKADPKMPNVHFGLGYLLWTQKQYPEAAGEFQAELANDPSHEQSLVYLGDCYIQLNRPAESLPLLEKAAKLNPALSLAHLDLGIVYMDADRNDDALRELVLAAQQNPGDVNVHWRLSRLYRTLGRKDEARAEIDKASGLTKAADDELIKKIANGRQQPPTGNASPSPELHK